jgi:hypothetical protein
MIERLCPGFFQGLDLGNVGVGSNLVPNTPLSRRSTEARENLSIGEVTYILSPAIKNSRPILTLAALLADLDTCPIAYSWWKMLLRFSVAYLHAINVENPLN